jgi:hypothetical protein
MKIQEADNPEDRLMIKLKGLDIDFTDKVNEIIKFCNQIHRTGNLNTKKIAEDAIDSLLFEINKLISDEYEDNQLNLRQEIATKHQKILLNQKSKL